MSRRRMGDRGSAALEFGLLWPALFLIMAAIIEVSVQATVAAALDIGARKASRMGITGSIDGTGNVASDQSRTEALRNLVLSSSGGILSDASEPVAQSPSGTS